MVRFILLTLLLTFKVLSAKAQDEPRLQAANKGEDIFCMVETMPYLLLKTEEARDLEHYKQLTTQHLLQFIYSHFRYPPISKDMCISGTVIVSFTIGADGLINPASIRCVRDLGGGIGDEAKRVIKLMADLGWQWVPGKQRGVPVPVQYNLPIRICLK
jgi:protein TonB